MAYGCVYICVYAPEGSNYSAWDILVRPCDEPCAAEYTISGGPDDGTQFLSISDECMEWPPEEGRTIESDATVVSPKETRLRAKGARIKESGKGGH